MCKTLQDHSLGELIWILLLPNSLALSAPEHSMAYAHIIERMKRQQHHHHVLSAFNIIQCPIFSILIFICGLASPVQPKPQECLVEALRSMGEQSGGVECRVGGGNARFVPTEPGCLMLLAWLVGLLSSVVSRVFQDTCWTEGTVFSCCLICQAGQVSLFEGQWDSSCPHNNC